jgi:two-component system cell cycle sensor histidine kinase/response regulator CckA
MESSPNLLPNGDIIWNGIVYDITERRRSEELLRLTRFSIEHSSDGIFWMTPDGRIIDVNEAACLSLGYSRDELLQLTIPDIDPNVGEEAWLQHFEHIRQHNTLKSETIHRTKSGTQFPVEIVANYIKYGSKEHICTTVRDITERKRLEEEKLEMERHFQQTQRLESLGVLAGGIAHDFNNILMIIMGNCSLAKMAPENITSNLDHIEKASERAAALCRQMLEYAGHTPKRLKVKLLWNLW